MRHSVYGWFAWAALVLLCTSGGANVGDWKSFSRLVVRRIAVGSDAVWAATDGGIIRSSLIDGSVRTYSSSDGLPDKTILSVLVDSSGTAWFGTGEGGLLRFRPSTGLSLPVLAPPVLAGQISHVAALAIQGARLYVGHATGVTVLDRATARVIENYHQMGPSSDLRNAKVTAIAVIGSRLLVATEKGLSWGDTGRNLLLPGEWSYVGSPFVNAPAIQPFGGKTYVATASGVWVEESNGWRLAGAAGNATDLVVFDDALWVAASNGLSLTTDGGAWRPVASLTAPMNALGAREGVGLVVAGEEGSYRVSSRSAQIATKLPGVDVPPTNMFTNIAVDTSGYVWVAPGPARGSAQFGVFCFRDNTWVHFPPGQGGMPAFPTGEPDGGFIGIAVDVDNRVWAGTWGQGIAVISRSGSTTSVEVLNSANTALTGLDDSPTYIVSRAFTLDPTGAMYSGIWHSGLFAFSRGYTPGGTLYHSTAPYLANGTISRTLSVTAVARDRYGILWVGTSTAGVLLIDTNGTPLDGSDDQFVGTLGREGMDSDIGMRSRNVRSIAVDREGVVWVGTDAGLTQFSGQFVHETNRYTLHSRHYTLDDGLPSNSINAVMADSFNVRWVGTDKGLAQVTHSNQVIALPLDKLADPDGKVASLAFDRARGYVWIGTALGLTRYEAYSPMGEGDIVSVQPSQNPYLIGISQRGADYVLTGAPLAFVVTPGATIRVYTITGELVWEKTDSGIGQVSWDGRTQSPSKAVASGIYVYVAERGSQSAVGKIAVIRDAR